jgi:ribosomal protein L11 methyltransferase
LHGSIQSLGSRLGQYDIVLANINLNVLTSEMELYDRHLVPGGTIAFSGFYTSDVPALKEVAARFGLQIVSESSREDWACALFVKTEPFA